MTHIQVILGSTRQGRAGEKVARWFMALADAHTGVDAELVDLADWDLPFLSTPTPPMFGQYDERTQAWADKIGQADGYVIITPEYNHGYPGVLKNAIDHLFREWNHKPVSFVGYGGPGGGLRAVEQLRQVVVELEMVPLRQQVSIPAVYAAFDQSGALANPDAYNAQAMTVLDELSRWAGALRQVRSAVVA